MDLRSKLLSKSDLKTEKVAVPEWDEILTVRTLTARERDDFELALRDGDSVNLRNVRARLVAATVVDDSGARVFSDADAEALGDKNAAALDRIFDVASRLSGLSKKDVEELAKN